VNWLEVGCPHCPNVLTLPPNAAGRPIRCPDCERLYLVPTPDDTPDERRETAPDPAPGSVPAVAARPEVAKSRPPTTDDEPRLAVDSPLPELPILAPPQATPAMQTAATPEPARAAEPPRRPQPPSIRPQLTAADEPSRTLAAVSPPNVAAAETTDDAHLRMRRAELRARANLIVFVVGVLVMIVFAFIVVRLSRR